MSEHDQDPGTTALLAINVLMSASPIDRDRARDLALGEYKNLEIEAVADKLDELREKHGADIAMWIYAHKVSWHATHRYKYDSLQRDGNGGLAA